MAPFWLGAFFFDTLLLLEMNIHGKPARGGLFSPLLSWMLDQHHTTINAQSRTTNATTCKVARTACQRAKRSSFTARSFSSSGVFLRLSIMGAALVVAKV